MFFLSLFKLSSDGNAEMFQCLVPGVMECKVE